MHDRLQDLPVYAVQRSAIPAAVYNLWRRAWNRLGRPQRIPLPGLTPMVMLLDERAWVCVDASLNDMPVLAWTDFEDRDRGLHEAVACTVKHYHFGGSKIRDPALEKVSEELERLLQQ